MMGPDGSKRPRARFLARSVLALLAVGGVAACTDGPSPSVWCDDHLCDWEVRGDVRKVKTWHARDVGVSLGLGTTIVHQELDWGPGDGRCMSLSLVADFGEDASLVIGAGVLNSEFGAWSWADELLPISWTRVSHRFPMLPDEYQGVSFFVSKVGRGRAIVADLEARIAPDDECLEHSTPFPHPK